MAGGVTFGYDARGNLTSGPPSTYGYDQENRLIASTGSTAAYTYDPLGRLEEQTAGTTSRVLLGPDGQVIGNVDTSGAIQRRWIPGPGTDESVAWYEGSGTTDRRYLSADALGSITAVTDTTGAALGINTYDPYGVGGGPNLGAVRYTGQYHLPTTGLYYYKSRVYAPALGQFLQTDPIGYNGGMNLYAYVGGDPVNLTDPMGLLCFEGSIGSVDLGDGLGTIPSFDTGRGCTSDVNIGFSADQDSVDESPNSGRVWGTPKTLPQNTQQTLCPRSVGSQIAGKLNALPYTLAGLAAAGLQWLTGTPAIISVGNNAIQVLNSPFISNRALTVGNVTFYGGSVGPGSRAGPYSDSGPLVPVGPHEEGHTLQYEALGINFASKYLAGLLKGDSNPLELGADKYARGQSCSGL